MIQKIAGLPEQIIGFDLNGEITKEDYDNLIFPTVKAFSEKYGSINLLMVLNTEVKEFKLGAWIDDAIVSLKHLSKWNHVAFVSNENIVRLATKVMDKVMPGRYRTFRHEQKNEAVAWLSGIKKE